MGRNTHRAREIRRTTFGRDMRENIALSIEKTNSVSVKSINEEEKKHDTRVISVETSEIQDRPDYFVLSFSRQDEP